MTTTNKLLREILAEMKRGNKIIEETLKSINRWENKDENYHTEQHKQLEDLKT